MLTSIRQGKNLYFVYLVNITWQEQNIDKLTQALVDKTQEVCPSLLDDAKTTATRYNTLLKLYAKCDNLFNRGDFLTNEEIHNLGKYTVNTNTLLFHVKISIL